MVEAEGQGLKKREKGRLSDEQKKGVQGRAIAWRQKIVAIAHQNTQRKGQVNGGWGGKDERAFFPEVFRIASELIEHDTGEFCDHAEEVFEEIEAFGQEPELDDDWVGEITGENDSFYFSTDSLVRGLEPLPGQKRSRKSLTADEVERITREVSNAIIDDGNETELSFEQALAVAHAENVDDWINAIKAALEDSGNGEMEFWGLQQLTKLRPAELFLGLLLGQQNWELGQPEFYGQITVCQKEKGGGSEGDGRRE
ncbi:MAG: hypothetical protein WBD47_11900 [Phormidesmis sp.]